VASCPVSRWAKRNRVPANGLGIASGSLPRRTPF
jgi:hypothetical protein